MAKLLLIALLALTACEIDVHSGVKVNPACVLACISGATTSTMNGVPTKS